MQKARASSYISKREHLRLLSMLVIEKRAREGGFLRVAGADEAGRGPLAGPVVASVCLLPEGYMLPHLNDSKQLKAPLRERIYRALTENKDISFGVGVVEPSVIDRINILQATYEAVRQALGQISPIPDYLICDGMRVPGLSIPCERVVRGDELSLSCAAASVIAKVTRDQIMLEMHEKWPEYGFLSHKGYGTEEHIKAIERYGPCPIHRKSFSPFTLNQVTVTQNVTL